MHARFGMQNVSGKTTVFRCVTSTTYRREPPYNPVIPSVAQHFAKNCFAIRLECRLNASPYLKPAWARPCLPARAGGNRRNAEIKAKGEGDHPACTKPQSQERTGIPLWVPYFRVAVGDRRSPSYFHFFWAVQRRIALARTPYCAPAVVTRQGAGHSDREDGLVRCGRKPV